MPESDCPPPAQREVPAEAAILVIAKAPEPGKAKTRLASSAGDAAAADIAAASLLDTLEAAGDVAGGRTFVGWTGELGNAARADEVAAALAGVTVFQQRGDGLGERLAAAHYDVAAAMPGAPVLQIGMDTPQVTGALLETALARLARGPAQRLPDAVLGPAEDGGWWGLGLRDPRNAEALRNVPMSRPDTGEHTRSALLGRGLSVVPLPALADVDTIDDAHQVAALAPHTRFAAALSDVPAPVGEAR